MPKLAVSKVAVVCASLLVACLLSEGFIRLMGMEPWRTYVRGELRDLTTEPDDRVGWINKPGTYRFKVGREIRNTILPDRRRSTGVNPGNSGKTVVLFGDSVMYGYGVDDSETVGSKLQLRVPNIIVENRAVPGYGNVQSLLSIRHAEFKSTTAVVVNVEGYFEERDVADPNWIEVLTFLSSSLNVKVPYADLDSDGKLRIFEPEPYWMNLPLRTRSALITLIEQSIKRFGAARRCKRQREVSLAVVRKLKSEVQGRARLLVTGFLRYPSSDSLSQYEKALREEGIEFKWCVHPQVGEPDFKVPGDPHPNGIVHEYMAECLAERIRSWPDF